MDCSRAKYDSVLLNKIGSHVCQTIIFIHEQQPELLVEKYRDIPWQSSRNQSNLNTKLIKVLSETSDWYTLLKQIKKLLRTLLIPESFESPILVTLLAKINLLNPDKEKFSASTSIEHDSKGKSETSQASVSQEIEDYNSFVSISNSHSGELSGIAVLMLDIENLQFNLGTEQFLHQISKHPLQVKIAFANWCAMGSKDSEFHQMGYDLIHVPVGKDNSDAKMIAFGVSIPERYSQVKEVFVCSGDHVMANLCSYLQKSGIVVYHVTQKGNNIEAVNAQNHELYVHTITPATENLLDQIKEIITIEESRTAEQWFKLSRISQLFLKKYNIELGKAVSHQFPHQTVRDFFQENTDLVLHEAPGDSEIYVALFKMPHRDKMPLKTQSDLEKALVKIVSRLMTKTNKNYVTIESVSSRFQKQYGQPVSKVIEKLDLDANLLEFLHSCQSFEVEKIGDRWQVMLKQNSQVKASTQPEIAR